MPITDLIPWKRSEPAAPEEEKTLHETRQDPLLRLQEQLNRMFDDLFGRAGWDPSGRSGEGWGAFSPRVDVAETDKEIRVTAELPGLEERDIDVRLSRDGLTISGEKRQSKEEKGHNYLSAERCYGSFRRSIPLPSEVDASKSEATFRNGVLAIALRKTARMQERKTLSIKAR